MGTYWEENGKYQEMANKINDMMPDFEHTDNKYLNLFITASRIYYRYFNDGDNPSEFEEDYNEFIKPFKDDLNISFYELNNEEDLENFVDNVLMFLSDKNLEYTQYSIYVNHDKKELSYSEKENSRKVISGTEKYLNDWIKSFQNYGYSITA